VSGTTQLILTQFDVCWIVQPHDSAWLGHRFEPFDHFCFPLAVTPGAVTRVAATEVALTTEAEDIGHRQAAR
jgi:hypothetical protein